ncbi:MAG: aminopeptidase [Comamonadaceae bacterium]|nr:aminopeptidase [Comamonadaceae bacterium]
MRDFAVQRAEAARQRAATAATPTCGRRAAVWNVVAAPELSLHARRPGASRWWAASATAATSTAPSADALAAQLQRRGLRGQRSTACRPTRRWAGPTGWAATRCSTPSSSWPEGELARLIFHELAHQVAYADDDTDVQRVVRHRGRAHRRPALAGAPRPRRGARAEYAALRRAAQRLPRADAAPPRARSTRSTPATATTPTKRDAQGRAAGRDARRVRSAQGRRAGAASPATTAGSRAPTTPSLGVQARLQRTGAGSSSACSSAQGRDFERFYAEVRRLAALAEGRAARRHSPPSS